jgi:ribosome-binding protein aMBF1 (putative translation factor)
MFVRVFEALRLHTGNKKTQSEDVDNFMRGSDDMRERIQNARIQNRLSLNDLGEKVDLSPECIAAFERGDELLDNDDVQKIMRTLKIK